MLKWGKLSIVGQGRFSSSCEQNFTRSRIVADAELNSGSQDWRDIRESIGIKKTGCGVVPARSGLVKICDRTGYQRGKIQHCRKTHDVDSVGGTLQKLFVKVSISENLGREKEAKRLFKAHISQNLS